MVNNSLAILAYSMAPLNRYRDSKEIKNKIQLLSIDERIDFLIYSFNNFDKNYNYESEFEIENWKFLILKMFPRKDKVSKVDLRKLNTGCYFDIELLNGIIGVSPFEYIFKNAQISRAEKIHFYDHLKYYGLHFFYVNEREMIEDIVNLFDNDLFNDIVKCKEKLLKNNEFSLDLNHTELLNKYIDYFQAN